MTIERRIHLITGIIVLFVLIIGSILLHNSYEVERGLDEINASSEVVGTAFLMRTVMDEYLAHGDVRPLRQWLRANELLGKAISDAQNSGTVDRASLKRLEAAYQDVNDLHSEIVKLGTAENQEQDSKQLKATVTGMMAVRLEELVTAAQQIHRSSQSKTQGSQRLSELFVLIACLGMIGLLILNLHLIKQAIILPLQELARAGDGASADDVRSLETTDARAPTRGLTETYNAIVERIKTAQEAVQSERQRLYDILEALPVMVCLLTPDYHVAFANRSFREKFGEDNGRRCYDYCFGQKEPCEFCESYKVLKTGEPHQWEVTGPDGSIIAAYDYPFTDTDGSPLILEMDFDITEQRRAQEKLSNFAKKIEDLYNNAPCGYHSLDSKGVFVRVNDTELSWLGYTREEIIGKMRGSDLCDQESRKLFEESYPGFVERGWVKDLQFNLIRKDGTILPVLLSATAIKDSSGKFLTSRSTMYDMTDRKRAEEAVKAERQRLYDVLETLPVYVCLLDSDYRMRFANKDFRETFGESQGRRCHDFLFDRTEPCEICETYTVMKTRAPHHWYWTGPNMRDYDIYDFPFMDTDGSFLILEMGIDITERRQAEDALNRTLADLTRSNEDLQQFAYVASHDLQEPLRNVATCLQLLEKDYKNKLGADADQYIHYAVDSAARMKNLIQDLLAYSRVVTKGKAPERVECEQVLDRTKMSLDLAIAEAGAVITHDPLPTIYVDDTQLFQVFQNLIGNAIKFRRDEPPKIHVSAAKNASEWIFSIKDNGIGIESRHLDRIFVIFQRLHKKSEYQGTGMGLAIVKKVIERHGGRVWVESEPGVGSTFYFTIPAKGIQK